MSFAASGPPLRAWPPELPAAQEPARRVTRQDYRSLMAGFPTGVAIVTAMGPGHRPAGMTCTSLCSVSLDPPTLLVCLRRGSPTLEAVLHQSGFTVNLMHSGAQAVAELFASGAPDRFNRVRWHAAARPGGLWLPDHAHASADCLVTQLGSAGDHVIVFGEVCAVSVHGGPGRPARGPLLYGLRRYAGWPGATDGERSPDDGDDPADAQGHESQRRQVWR